MARGWLAEGGCSWENASFRAWSRRLAVQRLSGQEPQLPRPLVETCLHKRPPSHSAPETRGLESLWGCEAGPQLTREPLTFQMATLLLSPSPRQWSSQPREPLCLPWALVMKMTPQATRADLDVFPSAQASVSRLRFVAFPSHLFSVFSG